MAVKKKVRLEIVNEFFKRQIEPIPGLEITITDWPPPIDHYTILDLLKDPVARNLISMARGKELELATPSLHLYFDGFNMTVTTEKDGVYVSLSLTWTTIPAMGQNIREALTSLLEKLKNERDIKAKEITKAEEAIEWFRKIWSEQFDIDDRDIKMMKEIYDKANVAINVIQSALARA